MDKLPVLLVLSFIGGIYGWGIVFAAMFFCVPVMISGKANPHARERGLEFAVLAGFVGLCFGMWITSTLRLSAYILSFLLFSVSSFIFLTSI